MRTWLLLLTSTFLVACQSTGKFKPVPEYINVNADLKPAQIVFQDERHECPIVGSWFGDDYNIFGRSLRRRPHIGIDIVVDEADVLAAQTGEVVASSWEYSSGGNFIVLRHSPSQTGRNFYVFTYYLHLKPDSALVKVGDVVNQGQKIATSGRSGLVADSPSHIHFEVTANSDGKFRFIRNGYLIVTGSKEKPSRDINPFRLMSMKPVGGKFMVPVFDPNGQNSGLIYPTNCTAKKASS